MTVQMATLSAILKDIYEGDLREQLNHDVVALRRLERSSAGITSRVGGKDVTFPVHYGRNSGIGARAEYADLPKAGYQATEAARIPLRYLYGSISLSGQTFELADNNTQAFISALDLEVNGLRNDLAKDLNRQVYGNGSGEMGTATTATNGTSSISAGNDVELDTGFRHLGINTIVDIYKTADMGTASPTPVQTAATVTKVNRTSKTVQFDKAADFSAGNLTFVRTENYNKEWTGLDAIVNDSGVLYDIDPDDVDQWRGNVDGNSGTPRSLTELLIIQNIDNISVGKTSLLLTSKGVRRSYFTLLVQNREFVNTTQENKKFEGGFTGLGFTTDEGEVPLVSDADAPPNTLWGLDEKHLKVYRDKDWSFMDRDGSRWVRVPGSAGGTWKDAYSATMFQYSELGTDVRGSHFKIEDLKEDDDHA